jgi:CheY-like chemotaxis protein
MSDAVAGKHILVVEDDYFVAVDLSSELEQLGASVVGPAGSVRAALTLLANPDMTLDAATLDVNLNGDLIYPVADTLLARRIPFVFCTGYDQRAIPAEYHSVRRCNKPFQIHSVIRALAEELRSRDPEHRK